MSDSKSLLGKYVEIEEGDVLFIAAVFSLFDTYGNKENFFIVFRQAEDVITSEIVEVIDSSEDYYVSLYGKDVNIKESVSEQDGWNLSEDKKCELLEKYKKCIMEVIKQNRVREIRSCYNRKTSGKICKIPYYQNTMRALLQEYLNPESTIIVFSDIKKNKRIDY